MAATKTVTTIIIVEERLKEMFQIGISATQRLKHEDAILLDSKGHKRNASLVWSERTKQTP